eukprot:2369323-Amphidinium_carterae.1
MSVWNESKMSFQDHNIVRKLTRQGIGACNPDCYALDADIGGIQDYFTLTANCFDALLRHELLDVHNKCFISDQLTSLEVVLWKSLFYISRRL